MATRIYFVAILITLTCFICVTDGLQHEDILAKLSDYKNESLDFTKVLPLLKTILNQLDVQEILDEMKVKQFSFTNSTMKCLNGFKSLNKQDLLTVFDATGKPGAGIALSGYPRWIGSYRECMNNYNTHYCLENNAVVLNNKLPLTLGLCVPSICDAKSVAELVKYITNYTQPYIVYSETNDAITCYAKTTSYNNGAIAMILISVVIAALCFFGSVLDVIFDFVVKQRSKNYGLLVNGDKELPSAHSDKQEEHTSVHFVKEEEGNLLVRFLLCFSLIKNTKSIFNTDVPPGAITSINGIRVLSITWVIEGHAMLLAFTSIDNMLDFTTWLQRFTMQTILNAPVSVDTFFLLSGTLVAYLSMKRFQSHGTLPLLRYYLHRYIRLTPSYAYVIFLYTYLYPIMTDGPLWVSQGPGSDPSNVCIEQWWTNLLYINNIYNSDLKKMCLAWSWYLANDMQFYVVSPIILYAMYRLKWIGVVIVNGIFLLAFFITNGVLMHTKHASPVSSGDDIFAVDTPSSRYSTYLYTVPWTRMGPYLIGLILGYILMAKTKYERKMKNLFYGFGWLAAIGIGVAVVYGPYSAHDYTWKEPSIITYGVMFRVVWAVAVGWVIYACHNGYGGLINDFLSWKVFIPLSRLTYATYLIHLVVMMLFFSSQETLLHMTLTNLVFYTIGIVVMSFASGFIIAVTIEYPVLNLEKLFLKF